MEVHGIAILHPRKWPRATRRLFRRDSKELMDLWHKIFWQASSLGGGVLEPTCALDDPELSGALVICFRDSAKRDELADFCARAMGESGITIRMGSVQVTVPGDDPEVFRDCLDPDKPAARL